MTRLTSRLDALTGARFLAAFHVFMFHAWAARGFPTAIQKIEGAGHMAVRFFFVLSGFILTVTYGKRGFFNLRDFAIARFARIYPVYVLCLLVAAGLYMQGGHLPTLEHAVVWIKSIFLVQSWFPSGDYALSGPAWTLSAEVFFYITFPLLLRITDRWQPSKLWIGIALVGLGHAAAQLAGLHFNSTALDCWPEFILGVLTGRLYLRGLLSDSTAKATGVFGTAFLLTLVVPQFYPTKSDQIGGMMSVLFGAMILGLANTDALPARVLRSKVLVFLGGASYALYLFHGYVLYGLNASFDALHRRRVENGVVFALVASVLTVALSSALFVWLEEPSREWIRKRFMTGRSPETKPENATMQAEPL